jgi:hypothetical protein
MSAGSTTQSPLTLTKNAMELRRCISSPGGMMTRCKVEIQTSEKDFQID